MGPGAGSGLGAPPAAALPLSPGTTLTCTSPVGASSCCCCCCAGVGGVAAAARRMAMSSRCTCCPAGVGGYLAATPGSEANLPSGSSTCQCTQQHGNGHHHQLREHSVTLAGTERGTQRAVTHRAPGRWPRARKWWTRRATGCAPPAAPPRPPAPSPRTPPPAPPRPHRSTNQSTRCPSAQLGSGTRPPPATHSRPPVRGALTSCLPAWMCPPVSHSSCCPACANNARAHAGNRTGRSTVVAALDER